ncbi:hypothetical protein RN001_007218 [Aquatica leii]|uniref:Beta-galactoside alpha-2,6-sialyltransferase 1 n=1 Tax=Aquatica leii TaxID=1421715 RepID=A0AAN7P820_9COLE|nr:hypothetical protein RN001_007218 [Aquatica leii]
MRITNNACTGSFNMGFHQLTIFWHVWNEPTTAVYNYDQQIYYYNRGYPPSYFNYSLKINATDRQKRSRQTIKENPITIVKNSRPRFPSSLESEFNMDTTKYRCLENDSIDECDIKTSDYKTQLLKELQRVCLDESSILKNKNPYNVHYNGSRSSSRKDSKQLLCLFKNVRVRTLTKSDYPFSNNSFKDIFPRRGLFENKRFKSCAIVASAGSLTQSNLGDFIDSHDMVLRFNHAPTDHFERDVGSKTTFRIVNSQVVSKPTFGFLHSSLYRNITILIWDPSRYMSSLEEWFKKPDFNLFTNYLEHRSKYKKTKSYILNPQSLWELWIFLQKQSVHQMRRNPPSSGFLGLAVLLSHCDYVDMFEYIPSVRVTKRCHYYDAEDNPACTFGVWHPLASEKLFAYSLNIASDKTVFQNGYIRIPGFKKYC